MQHAAQARPFEPRERDHAVGGNGAGGRKRQLPVVEGERRRPQEELDSPLREQLSDGLAGRVAELGERRLLGSDDRDRDPGRTAVDQVLVGQ
jgi:hypothetical protein